MYFCAISYFIIVNNYIDSSRKVSVSQGSLVRIPQVGFFVGIWNYVCDIVVKGSCSLSLISCWALVCI